MKWISVKERKPENEQAILVFDRKSKEVWKALFVFYSKPIYSEEWQTVPYDCCNLTGNKYLKNVTHWMPLPEPPKDSE